MAEFCLDCWNKINGTNHKAKKYIMSDYSDICEECECCKPVIIMEKKAYYLRKFRYLLIPLRIIDFLIRLLCFPYFIYIWYKYRR